MTLFVINRTLIRVGRGGNYHSGIKNDFGPLAARRSLLFLETSQPKIQFDAYIQVNKKELSEI